MLQVLPEILGDDVQLPRVLLGLLRLAGLRDGAGEELERGGLGPPAGHQVGGSPRLRVLRGLGLLPRHRAGPGQCMCVSLRHKDVSQGHHVFTERTKMGILLSELNDNNYLNLEGNAYVPINRDEDKVNASKSSFGSYI